jgi:hypothetical protein
MDHVAVIEEMREWRYDGFEPPWLASPWQAAAELRLWLHERDPQTR